MALSDSFGKLVAEVELKTDKFRQGIRRASDQVKSFATKSRFSFDAIQRNWMQLTAAIATTAAFRSAVSSIDEIAKSAKRMGLAAEEFQKLSFAAELSGTSMENVQTAMAQFTRKLSEIETGSKRAKDAIETLERASGMKVNQRDRQEAFNQVLTGLSRIEDETLRAKLALELLGARSASNLLPLLASLDQAQEQASMFNVTISESALSAFEQFQDALSTTAKTTLVLFAEALTPVVAGLTALLGVMNTVISGMSTLTEKVRTFFETGRGESPFSKAFGEFAEKEGIKVNDPFKSTTESIEKVGEAAQDTEQKAGTAFEAISSKASNMSASIKSSFSSAFSSIAGQVSKGNPLLNALLGPLFGAFGTVVGGKVGGFLNTQFGNTPPAGATTPKKALGGTAMPNTRTLVGEKGPEEVIFGSVAKVVPNNQLGRGSGGHVINQTLNIMPDVNAIVQGAMFQNLEAFKRMTYEGFNEALAKNQV